MTSPLRTLYLCYFGVRQPLVQTQVLPYLRQLVQAGVEVSILTFEPDFASAWPAAELEAMRARLWEEGIRWHALPYHKSPSLPATLYDIAAGARQAVRIARREGLHVLHGRAHIAMAMALLARPWTGCSLVFDIRGLIAEEYADAGIWAEGSLPFRGIKALERAGIRQADEVVVLTRRLREHLVRRGEAPSEKIEVIPCCVDFARYGSGEPSAPKAERFEVIYAGSVTGLYLLDEIARFFLAVRRRRPDALLRILTSTPPAEVGAVLEREGVATGDYWVGKAPPDQVPGYLRRAHLGVSFRKATFSQIGASPTKIAEYLAAGLPVVANAGIGDMDQVLRDEGVGVVLDTFDPAAHERAADEALGLAARPDMEPRCIEAAHRHFDLVTVGRGGYRSVYERIAARRSLRLAEA